jgi:predicted dehydrogenase
VVHRLVDSPSGRPEITVERRSAPDEEPLQRQLESFVEAVRARSTPVVSASDGRKALSLAHAILDRIASD